MCAAAIDTCSDATNAEQQPERRPVESARRRCGHVAWSCARSGRWRYTLVPAHRRLTASARSAAATTCSALMRGQAAEVARHAATLVARPARQRHRRRRLRRTSRGSRHGSERAGSVGPAARRSACAWSRRRAADRCRPQCTPPRGRSSARSSVRSTCGSRRPGWRGRRGERARRPTTRCAASRLGRPRDHHRHGASGGRRIS